MFYLHHLKMLLRVKMILLYEQTKNKTATPNKDYKCSGLSLQSF